MSSRFDLRHAAQICRQGGVIAYPTESVFGLGCDPLNQDSVHRILDIKQRDVAKGLILLSDNLHKLMPFITINSQQQILLQQQSDKPTTWLVAASALTPAWICGAHSKVAIRVTRHKVAAALCSEVPWPIVSTSANPAQKKPARSAMRVHQYFGQSVDCIISGTVNTQANPSIICDLETGAIIRA